MSEIEWLHIKEQEDGVCEIHDWDFERIRRELIPLMRERYRKGGLVICKECIWKAKAEADRRRGL